MHYDGTLRGFFANPIMVDKKTGASIEVNREMSPIDIQKLNTMYPCNSTKSTCGKLFGNAYAKRSFFHLFVFSDILIDLSST